MAGHLKGNDPTIGGTMFNFHGYGRKGICCIYRGLIKYYPVSYSGIISRNHELNRAYPVMKQPVIMEMPRNATTNGFSWDFPQLLIGGATWVARDPPLHPSNNLS